MPDIVMTLLQTVGPWAALCAILLWWISKQIAKSDATNDKTIKRLQASEDWIRGTLVEMNTKMVDAMSDVTHAMREMAQTNRDNQRTNREILNALRSRPCMHEVDLPDAPSQKDTEPLIRRTMDHA